MSNNLKIRLQLSVVILIPLIPTRKQSSVKEYPIITRRPVKALH